MTILCNDCKYVEDCIKVKENPEIIGCCDFGSFDKHFNLYREDIEGEQNNG